MRVKERTLLTVILKILRLDVKPSIVLMLVVVREKLSLSGFGGLVQLPHWGKLR